MKKILCAIFVGLLAVSTVQAQQTITLDLPVGGRDAADVPITHADGSVFTTSVTDGGGATYDIEYTLNAFATDETVVDAFIKTNGTGTFFGVGSAPDGANTAQQESVDGADGERLSITNLSITNFVAGSDGLVAGDLSVAFNTLTIANGPSTQDGLFISFTDFGVNDEQVNRPGRVLADGTIPQPAEIDLTALPTYDAAATTIFLAPDNIAGTNRWSVAAITVEITGGTTTAVLRGDVNMDETVDFLDIAPFIAALSSGSTQPEADIDGNGTVEFLDIAPFIALLSGG